MKLAPFLVAAAATLTCAPAAGSAQQVKTSPTPKHSDSREANSDPCGDPSAESMAWSTIRGRVKDVPTGDNVVLLLPRGERLRVNLVGISAPALEEPFGRESRERLAALVLGREVEVWVNPSAWSYKDKKPDVITGVIHFLAKGKTDANFEQVRSGMARHRDAESYTMSNYSECLYVNAEERARESRRGLWGGVRKER